MKPFPSWRHPAGNMTALLLAVAAICVIALAWMGVRLIRQDRALEARQFEERREATADRIVASLEQVLAAEEQKLAESSISNFDPGVRDALHVVAGPGHIRVWPEDALLCYPVMPGGREDPATLYSDAEKTEFMQRDYKRTISHLRALSQSKDPAVRAGAQLRLARNLRKAGRREAALAVYNEMIGDPIPEVTVAGVPADLVARRVRCVLLEELRRAILIESESGKGSTITIRLPAGG